MARTYLIFGEIEGKIDVLRRSENFLRARIDDGPELGTVLHGLHVGGKSAVAVDPFLHRLRVVGQHVGGIPMLLSPGGNVPRSKQKDGLLSRSNESMSQD
jgi:hypothetical protein